MKCHLLIAADQLRAGRVEITGDDHHYLFRVRRLRQGDEIAVFDGAGMQAAAQIVSVGSEIAVLDVADPVGVSAPAPAIRILLPLMKGDGFDSCLSKLVELGVARIVPVRTRRCVVRISDHKAEARRERFATRARAAAAQSRNPHVPVVDPITELANAVAAADDALKLVCWEQSGQALRDCLPDRPPASIALLFGPEGGLESEEVDAATAAGFVPVSLGPRILRAETAPIVATSILRFVFGDF